MKRVLTPLGIVMVYAAFSALWIVLSGLLLTFNVDDPALQNRVELIKGLAYVLISSGLLYVMLQSWRSSLVASDQREPKLQAQQLRRLLPALASLALLVPLSGLTVIALHYADTERDTLIDLDAIAQLKAGQIEGWLKERHGDAYVLGASRGFADRVATLQRSASERESKFVRDRLEALQKAYGYESIHLLDGGLRPLLSLGEHLPVAASLALAQQAIAERGIKRSELFRDAAGVIHFDYAVALVGVDGRTVHGVVLLHVDPARFLFPLIRTWPSDSPSGETLLVRRDGNDALFLNDSRFNGNRALLLRQPLAGGATPAVAAVLAENSGRMSGTDYRGKQVLAAYRPVAGTDWRVVAKLDSDEVFGSLYSLAAWVSLSVLIAVAAVCAALLSLWRQQRRAHEMALQTQSAQLFAKFYDLPFVGMVMTSPTSKGWGTFNNQLCTILGYSRDELAAMTWVEVTHPDDVEKDVAEFDRVLRGETDGYAMEKRFLRKDGAVVHADIDVKAVRRADGSVESFFATVQDITERKLAEARAERVAQLYAALSDCNSAIVRCSTEQELFERICQVVVAKGRMKMAWIGIVDAKSGMVRFVASAGDGVDALAGLEVSVDPASPFGQGATGTAVRECRAVWVQDFMRDARTAPWHDTAARFGWGGAASLPLQRKGEAIGALALYSAEPNSFDGAVQDLLLEIATDVSFALDNFDRETERRRAETAMRDSELRHRALFDASIDAIILTDDFGHTLAANPAACAMFQCSEQELIEIGRAGTVDMSDPRVAAYLEERTRTGIFRGEITLVRRTGDKFPADISVSVISAAGMPKQVSIVARDVTERNRLTELVRQNTARMNAVLGSIDQVIWSVDAYTGEVLYLNPAAEVVYGRPIAAFRENPPLWLEALVEEDMPAAALMDQQIREKGRGEAELRIVRPDGEVRWVQMRGRLVRDDAGKEVRIDGVISDITDSKRSRLRLEQSEERFRGLIDQVIAGIYIIQEGKLVYVNQRYVEMFGYDSVDEVIGREVISFVAEPERDKVRENLRRRFAGEVKSLGYNVQCVRKDGTLFDISIHGSLATYDGRPAIIGMVQDISEKKRAEDKAERYLEQLQAAFMRTVEMATTISEMRDPYTAGHEKRVAEIAVAIAGEMGFDEQRLEGLRVAGYLHDVGKITIPAEILAKPGKLSPIEYQLIKGHPQASYDILKGVEFPWPVAQVAYQHHERLDGSGYPQGLKGEQILLEARIMAVADTVEAMSSHRPYRPGLGIDKALAEIERGRGSIYDPVAVDACLRLFRDKAYAVPG